MKKKTAIIALLSVFAASTAGAALMAGCNATVGRIDAPTSLEEDLGTYVIPEYDVVDENGMILAGYNVYLKSVKDSNGAPVDINYGSVTVDTAGVYSFVYSAGSNKVSDVTVSIDFADRTAPVINYDDKNLPDFFIRGNEYRMPQYTLSGDYVRDKCWAKVYYIAEDKTETEVQIDGGRFLVDKENGAYAIRIHVEDAVGNANDYEYVRKVDGPKTLVENRVLYFNEEFGARQVSCYDSAYKGEYVSKDTDGAHVYESEEGAYRVTFDGVTETRYNEGVVIMNVPALINLYEYERLEMWVYNDSDKDIVMGSMWWNDTKIEKGKWNKITWSTREWGGRDGNKDASNTKFIDVTDISKMTIRFLFDYDQKIIPNGTFYFSSMNAVPKTPSVITEKECATEGGGVSFDQSKYFINDTVNLFAKKVEGKTVDCYKVDGKVIPGDSFVVTKSSHEVEVVYTNDPLTLDGLTWASYDYVAPSGSDAQVYKLGEGKNWVLSFDVYDVGASGWNYFGAYVGGKDQLLGFELVNDSGKLSGYGGAWKWGDGVALSSNIVSILRGATEQKPATVKYLRKNDTLKTFVEYDGVSYFIATVSILNNLECIDGDSFGIGGRAQPSNVVLHNIRAVATETKTELVHATYSATITKGDSLVDFANKNYRIGDTVTLSAPKENNGKLFLCFKVGETEIKGNSFVITEKNVTVTAVYTDPCTITLEEGLTINGKGGTVTVASGTTLEIFYNGKSPDGKYYAGILVDGQEAGYTLTVTKDVSVTVNYQDRVENDNEAVNDISKAEDSNNLAYHPTEDGWRPSSVEYVSNGYDGIDGTVDANHSLKVTLSGKEQGFGVTNGIDDLGKYSEIYFYAYTEETGISVGGWWCGNTDLTAGKWTKVSFGRNLNPLNSDEKSVWENGSEKFIYRIMNGKAGSVVYVTGIYGVPYEDVTVTKDEASSQYLGLSAPKYGTAYKEKETVKLTCNGAPQNKAFVCFTVNGVDIEGDTYTLTAEGAEFGIRFADTSTLTFEDGASAAEGGTVFGKGATVKLTHEIKANKVFDYYLIDGSVKVFGNEFKTTATAHTVKAVYADNINGLTWETAAYVAPSGSDAKSHKLGEGTHWVMTFDVSLPGSGWNYVGAYIGGDDQLVGIELVNNDGKFGGYGGAWKGMTDSYNVDPLIMSVLRASSTVPTTMIYARSGDRISIHVKQGDNLYEIGQVNYSTYEITGNNFGIGERNGPVNATQSNIKFILGEDKVNAFIQNTIAIKLENAENGKLVQYGGTEYTLPEVTNNVVDLFGNRVEKDVTVSVKDAEGNNLPVNSGKITVPSYGGSQTITVTYSADGALSVSYKIILQKADTGILLEANAFGTANLNANGNTVAYSTEQHHGDDAGSIKISNIASNETGVFLTKSEYSRYVEFYAYTADSGIKMGGWWCNDTELVQNTWTRVVIDTQHSNYDRHNGEVVLRLTGACQGKTVYISSVKTIAVDTAE